MACVLCLFGAEYSGLTGGTPLQKSFQDTVLSKLLWWFKWEFFEWVNAPPCRHCGKGTNCIGATAPQGAEVRRVLVCVCVFAVSVRSSNHGHPLALCRTPHPGRRHGRSSRGVSLQLVRPGSCRRRAGWAGCCVRPPVCVAPHARLLGSPDDAVSALQQPHHTFEDTKWALW